MKKVQVGLIDRQVLSNPEAVIQILDARNQSAIAVQYPRGLKMIYRGAILDMMREGSRQVDPSRLHKVKRYISPSVSLERARKKNELKRPIRGPGFRGIKERREVRIEYIAGSIGAETVQIMTRSEKFAAMIQTTGGYRCTGVQTHNFPDPDVLPGQRCPRYRCLTADGRPSKIIAV